VEQVLSRVKKHQALVGIKDVRQVRKLCRARLRAPNHCVARAWPRFTSRLDVQATYKSVVTMRIV